MPALPRLLCLLLLLLGALPAAAAALTPTEILAASDRARGNLEGITWQVDMQAVEGGQARTRKLLIKARQFDVVAETLDPAQYRGHLLIMLQGNMWYYKPNLSKPVPVSQRQKLLGLAVNGDISSTNYARDYEVVSFAEAELDGRACYRFELQARTANTTYSRVRYWVTKQPLVGIRAEFYTPQGDRLLKAATMEYAHRVTTPDGPQPFISQMRISDELLSADTTLLSFSAPVLQAIPPHVFNLNLLRK